VRAYFTFDEAVLKEMCREAALAQATTFHKARETGNLGRLAGTVLSVSKVELFKAQTLEAGTPVIVLSALVQYIHCARNKKVSARREGGGWERGRQGPVPPRHAPHPISTPPSARAKARQEPLAVTAAFKTQRYIEPPGPSLYTSAWPLHCSPETGVRTL
jgi:hypothetical protein